MKKAIFIIFVFLFIFLTKTSFAALLPNSSLNLEKTLYDIGERVNVTVDFGLIDESADSKVVMDVNGRQITMGLMEFFEKAGITKYSCTHDCRSDYEAKGAGRPEIVLNEGENLIGFNLSSGAGLFSLNSLQFNVSPAVGEVFKKSCGSSALKIDILDDGVDWQHMVASGFSTSCNELSYNKECYIPKESSLINFSLTSSHYCEKIFLNETPKVKLAASVKKYPTVIWDSKIKMFIIDPDTKIYSEPCDLIEVGEEFYECILDYDVKKAKDYYICIYDDRYDEHGETYYIRGEKEMPKCGYVNPPSEASVDFPLHAQIAEIEEFPAFVFNDIEYKEKADKDLGSEINNYLSKYYSRMCEKGCTVPINLITKEKTKLSNAKIGYSLGDLAYSPSSYNFYNITKIAPLISTGKKTLNLGFFDLMITNIGSYKITFSIGKNQVGIAYFNVSSVPKIYSVVPLEPPLGMETLFVTNAASPSGYNLTNYEWDFGDGSYETTSTNSIKHTYFIQASYNLTLIVRDEKGTKASRTFTIVPGTPEKILNSTITQKRDTLNKFTKILDTLPAWYVPLIDRGYGITEIKAKLAQAERDFNKVLETGIAEDFLSIKNSLDSLVIPVAIEDTQILEEAEVLPVINEINLRYVKNIGGGTYNESSVKETREAISAWQSENLNLRINGLIKAITLEDTQIRELLTLFKVNVIPVQPLGAAYFIVILPPGIRYEDVYFDKNYGQKKIDGAVGLQLNLEDAQTISFAMPGAQDLVQTMFVSPSLDSLTVIPKMVSCGNNICEKQYGEDYKTCREDCEPTARTIKSILIVIFLGAVGIFLIWRFYVAIYDRLEQKRIFTTRKNYISVLIFIADAFNKGLNEEQVRDRLKKSGWNEEQIDYAVKRSKKAEKKTQKRIQQMKEQEKVSVKHVKDRQKIQNESFNKPKI